MRTSVLLAAALYGEMAPSWPKLSPAPSSFGEAPKFPPRLTCLRAAVQAVAVIPGGGVSKVAPKGESEATPPLAKQGESAVPPVTPYMLAALLPLARMLN